MLGFHTRRDFLKDAALMAAVGTGGVVSARADVSKSAPKKVGANDRINVAVIGYKGRNKNDPISGRGGSHIGGFMSNPESAVVAICDADAHLSDKAIQQIEDKQKIRPKFVQDLRRIMEDKSIDAVSIATPNHWHALAAIWAMQAGKDVYVEKPVSHNVSEGRRMVQAARHYDKICQTGTQSRSATGTQEFMEYIHAGKIGKIHLARALCYKRRGSIGAKKETAIPDSLNYDLWCGPAAMLPVTRPTLHYDWHWIWEYGNGDLGNQGIHEMDRARWGLNKKTLCNNVFSIGGRLGYEDAGETANTQICTFDYGDCQLIFEVRGLPTPNYTGANVGVIFYGSDGYGVSYSYTHAAIFTPDGMKVKEFRGGEDHYGNFLKAVKSRKYTDLTADIEEGHLSSALCHLGNISYRLGSRVEVKDVADYCHSCAPLGKHGQDSFTRMIEHLKENKIEKPALTVGLELEFDPKTETFPKDKQANALLTRPYRKDFVVPEKF